MRAAAAFLLLASCAQQPEVLDTSPPVGCAQAHVTACDAGFGPCVTGCKGEFNFELPPHCVPMCGNEVLPTSAAASTR